MTYKTKSVARSFQLFSWTSRRTLVSSRLVMISWIQSWTSRIKHFSAYGISRILCRPPKTSGAHKMNNFYGEIFCSMYFSYSTNGYVEATWGNTFVVWMLRDFCDPFSRGVHFFAFSRLVCIEICKFDAFFVQYTPTYDVLGACKYKVYTLVINSWFRATECFAFRIFSCYLA